MTKTKNRTARRRGTRWKPTLLLVGPRLRTEKVNTALSTLRFRDRYAEDIEDASALADASTIAVILTSRIQKKNLEVATRALRDSDEMSDMPLFVLVPVSTPDKRVKAIYEAGATAVFAWPREGLIVSRLIATLLDGRSVTTPDRALGKAVRARLKVIKRPSDEVSARVSDGIAFLSGEVDSLLDANEIERAIVEAPGIKEVVARDLQVREDHRSDEALTKAIRELIINAHGVDQRTIGVAVADRVATVVGTTMDRPGLRRVLRVISSVRGLTEIRNLTTISKTQQRRDQRKATLLQNRLDTMFPGEKIPVSVFGDVAVLTGRVMGLPMRRAIQIVAEDSPGIARVVNKIAVR